MNENKNKRILVIDDEPGVRELSHALLVKVAILWIKQEMAEKL